MKEPKIVLAAKRKLIAARKTMSLANNMIRELWQGFRPRATEIKNRVGSDFFSIQHLPEHVSIAELQPTTEFDKLAAVEVESQELIPDGLEAYTLFEGKYAVFIYKGLASSSTEFFQYITTTGFRIRNTNLIPVISSRSLVRIIAPTILMRKKKYGSQLNE